MDKQFAEERSAVTTQIAVLQEQLAQIKQQIADMGYIGDLSKEFLDRHAEIKGRIDALRAQNEAYRTLVDLQESKKIADRLLKEGIRHILTEIQDEINAKMKEFNDSLFTDRRQAPHLVFHEYNSYTFETPDDKLNQDNYLIKDGSLEYRPTKQDRADKQKYRRFLNNYNWVLGVSKNFNPEVCIDVNGKPNPPLGQVANVDRTDIALAQRIIKFSTNEHLNSYYLKYWIMSIGFQNFLMALSIGSTALGIKASKLFMLPTTLPSIKEQQQIVDYLDKKCESIEAAIIKKSSLVDSLTAYKKSFIYEVVTGKKEV